jgi:hypothetical protein
MNEVSELAKLLKTFTRVLTQTSTQETFKVYRELYQLGEPVIPEIEKQLLSYPWDDIKYGVQFTILSGFMTLANDINEKHARELGDKICAISSDEAAKIKIQSILDFTLDAFQIYPIKNVIIYQSKKLSNQIRIDLRMDKWLSMIAEEDLKKIERLYIIPKIDEDYIGYYVPILCNIMIEWNISRSYHNPLSPLFLFPIEQTLYHEIGHHVHQHTFGQHPKQEKEADLYARNILRRSHPILSALVRSIKWVFGKKKVSEERQ